MPQFSSSPNSSVESYSGPHPELLDSDLQYNYPMNLDLRPNSELHKRIVTEVLRRAKDASGQASKRWGTWREIERNVTAYVPMDDEETRIKRHDSRKPVRVVVPFSYLMRDIIQTYLTEAFLTRPYHRYDGVGPEDQLGAKLLEQVVDLQNIRFKNGLAYYIQNQDMLTYGFGVVTPTWETLNGFRMDYQPESYDTPWGPSPTGRMIKTMVEEVRCEGNKLHNIDPYRYFADPSTPIHRPQDAEFVAWMQEDNYYNLLTAEMQGSYFNVRYLEAIEGRSSLCGDSSGREEKYGGSGRTSRIKTGTARPVDKLIMYVNLIPAAWGLGTRTYPEKWMFVLGGDQIVLQAQPLNLKHGMFPVAICCPNFDGYTSSPISALEICFPLQEVADFVYSSRLAAVRKSLHDMFLVNPQMVYMPDVLNPSPSKVIRLRKSAWGQPLDNVLKQLEVRDVTGGHFKDLTTVAELIERVTGAVDILQGMSPDTGNDRTTALQVQSQHGAAVSRLQKLARIISIQSMTDMGFMLAEHTQQFMEKAQFVNITGQYAEAFAADLGPMGRLEVMPWDLNICYDVTPHDGTMPGAQYGQALTALFQQAVSVPELAMNFDLTRIFAHMMRLNGVNDIDSFRRIAAPMGMNVQAMPDEQVAAEAQAGNIRPLQGAAA
jgi:hypothetical protein